MPQKTPLFSPRFHDSLIKMAMMEEMARADRWQGIDECMAIRPAVLKTFAHYADAALRALKRMEQDENAEIPDIIRPDIIP